MALLYVSDESKRQSNFFMCIQSNFFSCIMKKFDWNGTHLCLFLNWHARFDKCISSWYKWRNSIEMALLHVSDESKRKSNFLMCIQSNFFMCIQSNFFLCIMKKFDTHEEIRSNLFFIHMKKFDWNGTHTLTRTGLIYTHTSTHPHILSLFLSRARDVSLS